MTRRLIAQNWPRLYLLEALGRIGVGAKTGAGYSFWCIETPEEPTTT